MFPREAIRSLSRGEARSSIRKAMNTYRWSRISNLSLLTRYPRISCIPLERKNKKISPLHELLQEDSQEYGSASGEKMCTAFMLFMQKGKLVS